MLALALAPATVSAKSQERRLEKQFHKRSNWLFYDTVAGANAAANLYSLIETCKANSVDPYGYLVALFKALPLAHSADDYEALLPWRVAASTD